MLKIFYNKLMFENKMIIRFILILVYLQPILGLMCYFCSDTSSAKGRNQCQTYYRTMRYYAKKADDTGTFSTDKYVKNCSDYGEPGKPKFCMISSVEDRNDVRSFIRDCSDGISFFNADLDEIFDRDLIKSDNQTTCKYTGQGYIACVTICGGDYDGYRYGNFCNGPVTISSASIMHAPLLLPLTLLKLTFF